MPGRGTQKIGAGGRAGAAYSLAWAALLLAALALYLGWGRPRLWGLLALPPAGYLLFRPSALVSTLGKWRWLMVVSGVFCGLGTVLLPLDPPSSWIARQSEDDRRMISSAVEEGRVRLGEVLREAAAVLEEEGATATLQEQVEAAWNRIRPQAGKGALTLIMWRGTEDPQVWAGSPYLVPGSRQLTELVGATAESGVVVAGDSLEAVAYGAMRIRDRTMAAALLLARRRGAPGPLPADRPWLQEKAPARLYDNLVLVPSGTTSGGAGGISLVTVEPGPTEEAPLSWPARRTAQAILLIMILVGVLGLLRTERSVLRGLLAAPLLYASVVPFATGTLGSPLNLDLITPSWTGHQLTNQAFLAVGAAALALWFVFAGLQRASPTTAGESFPWRMWLPSVALLPVTWGVGLALVQDLYRFAPTWFWARVSFLPAGRDLVGWLIAISMTMVLVGVSAGAAARLRHLGRLRTPLWIGLWALAGATGAWMTGAWLGTPVTGMAVAGLGAAAASVTVQRAGGQKALTLLLLLGLVGALLHLPLKWDMGRMLSRRSLEETAAALRESGVGLSAREVVALQAGIRRLSAETRTDRPASGSLKGSDRSAFLVWRGLGLSELPVGSGVLLSSPGGEEGRFATVSDLFDQALVDSLRNREAEGGDGMILTGGPPGFFGEETLLLGYGGPGSGGSIIVAARGEPLGFLTPAERSVWSRADPAGAGERSGRLVGGLYLRVYDEAYRLLAAPRTVQAAPEGDRVPARVVAGLQVAGADSLWHRRGWWAAGGSDEYYFFLQVPGQRISMPGTAVTEEESGERRIAVLGLVRPGIWGRVVETVNLLLLFTASLLTLAWLPAAVIPKTGMPLSRRIRRISFRTRLLIPLLVVALVPTIALWLFTRAFILNREASSWEEELDRSLVDLQAALRNDTSDLAADLAREAHEGSMASLPVMPERTRWGIFDADLVPVAGNLTPSIADRIPLRQTVLGSGPEAFILRTDEVWSAAIAPVGAGYSEGAALVVQPLDESLLREAGGTSPWPVDLYVQGRLAESTDPTPFAAGLLPRVLPAAAAWEGSRGRAVGAFDWRGGSGLRYLTAYRPITDYFGLTVATVAQRRLGTWGQSDPELDRLYATVASIYLLLVGAITLVALLIARRISDPIGSLTRSAGRVSGGDLDVEIPVTRGDEVGGLQKAFRQMLIALRENRERLAQAERERAWQEMARQVAHEIKNPLTPMQLSAQFLRRAYEEDAENLETIMRECTDSIVEQVEELRRIANEFSAYARLPQVQRTPTVLNEPVDEALSLFQPAMPDGVVVVSEMADEMPVVDLDPEQVRRVVINLIRNALDAMGEEGTLTIRTGSDHRHVWLQVCDTGEGIAPEVKERLFEPYFSTKTDGTGLGLAITRAVVDAHGGTLSVESRPGEGTTMTARFPIT